MLKLGGLRSQILTLKCPCSFGSKLPIFLKQRKRGIYSWVSVFYSSCHKYLRPAKNIMVLCLKEKKLFKFLTISVILYYLVLNQMWCSQNLAQLSRATQDNLDCTVLLPPLAIHHYRFLAPALLFTQPVQKDKPVPTQHRFFRGTCSSGQLYYCKSWLEGQSRNM